MFNGVRSLDRVLRGEATRPAELARGLDSIPAAELMTVVVGLASFYGVCMGVYAVTTRWGTPKVSDGLLQMLSSSLKVPSLLGLTLLVTGPSLYVFNALLGSRLRLGELAKLLTASVGVLTAVLASFGTILVFFSLCTESYSFIILLNVALFSIAGVLGLGFLLQTLHRLAVATATPTVSVAGETLADRPMFQPDVESVRRVFRVWVIVFGLIGAQMSWVLRPFVLNPKTDFVWFRHRESNFFQAVVGHAGNLFSDSVKQQR